MAETQKCFVTYGPPGTGKTSFQLKKVQRVRESGVPVSRIAYLSHTKAAAAEALDRLGVKRAPNVSTIHSLCFRLCNLSRAQVIGYRELREFGEEIGIPITGKSPEAEDEQLEEGDDYLSVLSWARNTFTPEEEAYDEFDRPGNLARFRAFAEGYEKWKQANGLIDFTDMLQIYVDGGHGIQEDTGVDIGFLDEAQDLTPLQWAAFRKIVAQARQVHIAGDDDQSIYSWAGADAGGMVRFEEAHEWTRRVILERSHRVPVRVHRLAQGIIHAVTNRVEKEYAPTDQEGRVRSFGTLWGLDALADDTLILYRNHASRSEIERWLLHSGIPYQAISGRPSPFQSKYGVAVRAWARLRDGGPAPNAQEIAAMSDVAATGIASGLIEERKWAGIAKWDWRRLFDMPHWAVGYFSDMDTAMMAKEPTVRISSIHGSKGREADRVILYNGMTARTAESFANDPDPEYRVFYVAVTRSRDRLDIVDGDNPFPLPLSPEVIE